MGIRFLKIAVIYLFLGALLGGYMGATENYAMAPVHAYVALLGWASLALAGVIYHLCRECGSDAARANSFLVAQHRPAIFHGRTWCGAHRPPGSHSGRVHFRKRSHCRLGCVHRKRSHEHQDCHRAAVAAFRREARSMRSPARSDRRGILVYTWRRDRASRSACPLAASVPPGARYGRINGGFQ